MELRHLRYFVAVAEENNVSRAAQKLHISQPGVSCQIRDLEDELGIGLFERTARTIRLTAEGHIFLREARAVLDRVDRALQVAKNLASGRLGHLRVGYQPGTAAEIVTRAMRGFSAELPEVQVSLSDLLYPEIMNQLRSRDLDLGVLDHFGLNLKGFEFREVQAYAVRVAMPAKHPLAKKRVIPLSILSEQPLIGYVGLVTQRENEAIFQGAGLSCPPLAQTYDRFESLHAAIAAGRGLALVDELFGRLARSGVVVRPLEPEPAPAPVGILTLRGKHSLLVEKFIKAAAER